MRRRRQSAHLTTDQVCQATGISRALLYRYESGEVVKLEVLERLAHLYQTSTGALLGLGNEYITHGLVFFDRLQRLEEQAARITTVFGPQAYMVSSDRYDEALALRLADLREDQPTLTPAEAERLMHVLKKRKALLSRNRMSLVNIIPVSDIQRYLEYGLGGHPQLAGRRAGRATCRGARGNATPGGNDRRAPHGGAVCADATAAAHGRLRAVADRRPPRAGDESIPHRRADQPALRRRDVQRGRRGFARARGARDAPVGRPR